MRARAFIILLLIVFSGLTYAFLNRSTDEITNTITPSISLSPTQSLSTSASTPQSGIQSSWIVVRDIDKISLYSNLNEKLAAKEAKEVYGCNALINGSFFGEDQKHIGLFITEGKTLSIPKDSTLFNGFFSIQAKKPVIASQIPSNAYTAIQTGPILMRNGVAVQITSGSEKARRMVAAVSSTGEVIFLTFYDSSSLALGPTLSELPKHLQELNKNTNLEIKDAINLDGGAHSAFLSDQVQLTDIQTPGSYFCVGS